MKSIKHWTPTFIVNRLANRNFRKKYENKNGGDLPCLATGAIQFLETYLTKKDNIFEFGSGFSTAWFANRVGKMISVEHDPEWYHLVKKKLSNVSNTQFFLIDSKENLTPISKLVSWDYVNKIKDYEKESFDFILNDGYARGLIALHSIDYLKKGGIFCWDDFASVVPPQNSTIYGRMRDHANIHETTKQFLEKVKSWRRVIFDDGCHSTALFFKPE